MKRSKLDTWAKLCEGRLFLIWGHLNGNKVYHRLLFSSAQKQESNFRQVEITGKMVVGSVVVVA